MCRGQKTLKSQKTKWWQKPLVTTAFYTDLTKGAWHATFYTLVHTVQLGLATFYTLVHTVGARYLLHIGTYSWGCYCYHLHTGTYSLGMLPSTHCTGT
jgi:hypothetical protein